VTDTLPTTCKHGHVGRMRLRYDRGWRNLTCLECVRLRALRRNRAQGMAAHGTPEHMAKRSGTAHPNWRGDEIEYRGMHQRLGRLGCADSHACVDCDGVAAEWSLDPLPGSTSVKVQFGGACDGLEYSTDPDDYKPRCVSCHLRLDRAPHRAHRAAHADTS
jgi:hypothetical protein